MIDFAEFLQALGRPAPYPWQRRLADRCARGDLPSVIAIPTGAGKTTTVDALLWALASQADLPAVRRTVGVRIVWAIDRRILVDEVHEHACDLVDRLTRAADDNEDPLYDVARRLDGLGGAGIPLVATRWRGGIDDVHGLYGPLQPQIITSTVAQIGSRLLFRGYGVGQGSLALEAALAACDTTICLDEAHLVEPLRKTIDSVRELHQAGESELELPGLGAITITATPTATAGEVMRLDDEDRVALGDRLNGPKRARLVEAEGATDRERVAALVDETLAYIDGGAETVACVANTVRRARDVFDRLVAVLAKREVDVALLIGPQRPADRSAMLDRHRAKLFERSEDGNPLVCVATQAFEVGLDVDVEAMVSESASAAALVQRLGRLNRRGDRVGRATIVRDDQCWLYRHDDDEPAAWSWLGSRADADGVIDVSVSALDRDPDRPPSRPRVSAPSLTPGIVDLLVQTSPRPGTWQDPDVEVFLRGVEAAPGADVSVCWRVDLRPELTSIAADDFRNTLMGLVPPQTQEQLTLSITAARALIAARYSEASQARAAERLAIGDADIEGEAPDGQIPQPTGAQWGVPFLVVRRGVLLRGVLGQGESDAIRPGSLQPGDIVVLPTRAGGVDEYGLAPRSDKAADVAADLRPGDRPAPVRITREAITAAIGGYLSGSKWDRIVGYCRAKEIKADEARNPAAKQILFNSLVADLREQLPDHAGLDLLGVDALERAGCRLMLQGLDWDDADDFDDTSLVDGDGDFTDGDSRAVPEAENEDEVQRAERGDEVERESRSPAWAWVLVPVSNRRVDLQDRTGPDLPPTLDAHARAVHHRLVAFVDGVGLSPSVRASLLTAARVHDHGKADTRIQDFFRRGVHAIGATPIAKSEFGTRDRQTERSSRERAGLPRGLRHEIGSVCVLSRAFASGTTPSDGMDVELALHASGTHHGLGRPIPPVPMGGSPPRPFRIDAAEIVGEAIGDGRDGWDDGEWLERFWRVIGRYGPWGVAYLEALLILADRIVSSEGF